MFDKNSNMEEDKKRYVVPHHLLPVDLQDWTKCMLTIGSHDKAVSAVGFCGGSRHYGRYSRNARSAYDIRKLARAIEKDEISKRSCHQYASVQKE